MPHTFSLRDLEEYLALFQGVFRRRDQRDWACLYLHGLLQKLPRKNIRAIARHAPRKNVAQVSDLSQALQHFLHQSPWDEQAVLRSYRAWLAERLPGKVLAVMDEVPILKQGRHSVGVQRQYSVSLGRKVNCQIAIVLHVVTANECYPVALRLYLPSRWLQSPELLAEAGVPLAYQQRRSRWQIALDLLAEVQQDGITLQGVVVGPGLLAGPEAWETLVRWHLPWLAEIPGGLLGVPLTNWAGASARTIAALDGRQQHGQTPYSVEHLHLRGHCYSWLPLRVALPARPPFPSEQDLWLFVEEQPGRAIRCAVVGNFPAGSPEGAAAFWQQGDAAAESIRQMKVNLGLDHFEGRSWRGFHHHACLVLLAQGFWRSRQPALTLR